MMFYFDIQQLILRRELKIALICHHSRITLGSIHLAWGMVWDRPIFVGEYSHFVQRELTCALNCGIELLALEAQMESIEQELMKV